MEILKPLPTVDISAVLNIIIIIQDCTQFRFFFRAVRSSTEEHNKREMTCGRASNSSQSTATALAFVLLSCTRGFLASQDVVAIVSES